MKNTYITENSKQTQKMGGILAKELKGGPARNASRGDAGGEIVCLSGELGSGKTTFAQGVLKGLGAKRPFTSPTFVVMKHYRIPKSYQSSAFPSASSADSSKPSFIENIYHVDAYRVGSKDILDLGWEEIIASKDNIVIIEWAEKIKKIIPKGAVWIKFRHRGKDKREIVI